MKKIKLFSIFTFAFLLFLGKSYGQTSPNFPDCKCGDWKVKVGSGLSAANTVLSAVNNGDLIEYQQGAIISLNAIMSCKSASAAVNNNYCTSCSRTAYQVLDESGGIVIDWRFGDLPREIDTEIYKCDKVYTLVLQGQCGCATCEPFIIKFKKKCCDCSALKEVKIQGPTFYCLKKPCTGTLTFTGTNFNNNCYKYSWAIDGVVVSGATTYQLVIDCNKIKVGDNKITLTVSCGDKTVSSDFNITGCPNPSPNFSMLSDGSGATFTPVTPACTNYWYLIKDNDKSCGYSSGDAFIAPSPMITNNIDPANFSGLVAGQQYVVYHFVLCRCGNNYCWNLQVMCFTWMPPLKSMPTGGSNGGRMVTGVPHENKISEMVIENIDEIPAAIKKDLPKEMFKKDLQRE